MSSTAPRITARKAFRGRTVEELKKELTNALADMQRQINALGRILPHNDDGTQPRGVRKGDRLMGRGKRGNVTGVPDEKGNVRTQEVPDSVTQFQDPQAAAGAPTTANFPTVGDFGWYRDTTGNKTYFVQNRAGALDNISLSTFSGNIGDLSGSITAAQHGVLTNNAVARHSNATGAADGFMSLGDKTLINTATDAATNSALCQRDSAGECKFSIVDVTTVYRVAGLRVIGAQVTGYVNGNATVLRNSSGIATTTSGGVTDVDFTAANFKILARYLLTIAFDLGVGGANHNIITA